MASRTDKVTSNRDEAGCEVGASRVLDDDTGPSRSSSKARNIVSIFGCLAAIVALGLMMGNVTLPYTQAATENGLDENTPSPTGFMEDMPTEIIVAVVCLLLSMSAFFSGSETAFFSIDKLRLKSMAREKRVSGQLVTRMMEHPGRLLTTILVGNMTVNVLISILLGERVAEYLIGVLKLSQVVSYILAVLLCTYVLVLFGEIMPKVLAMRTGERFARIAALPLMASDKLLGPVRDALLSFTDFIFRITRFSELRATPFITDEELKALLSADEFEGVIEEEKRQMIEGILEFTDAHLGEILVPRPDIIAISQDETVGSALNLIREHEFSRMPVYQNDLDHITGILFAKDLLPHAAKGDWERSIVSLTKTAHFVPETMKVYAFVKEAQRLRAHIAIVVDEFGGTEGIVTLEDALEEVVGDIMDENETVTLPYKKISDGVYRVDGGFALDELKEIIPLGIEHDEHETLAGFVMAQTGKVPEVGDEFMHRGALFVVESTDDKRAQSIRIELPRVAQKKGGDNK